MYFQVSEARNKERTGVLLKVAVSLDLVHKLFMKVRAYHKVRETLYFKVSVIIGASDDFSHFLFFFMAVYGYLYVLMLASALHLANR